MCVCSVCQLGVLDFLESSQRLDNKTTRYDNFVNYY